MRSVAVESGASVDEGAGDDGVEEGAASFFGVGAAVERFGEVGQHANRVEAEGEQDEEQVREGYRNDR